eukprot:13084-Heterococcus_DN1.PRE.1
MNRHPPSYGAYTSVLLLGLQRFCCSSGVAGASSQVCIALSLGYEQAVYYSTLNSVLYEQAQAST